MLGMEKGRLRMKSQQDRLGARILYTLSSNTAFLFKVIWVLAVSQEIGCVWCDVAHACLV